MAQWVWNNGAGSPLASISSENCSLEDTKRTCSSCLATLSLTKCTSISMCLVLWCWIGLQVRAIADKLSQNKSGLSEDGTWRKTNNCLIQSISAVVVERALYSASLDDQKTMFCFFDDKDIRLEPMKTTILVLDLLSLGPLPNMHHYMQLNPMLCKDNVRFGKCKILKGANQAFV